MKKLAFLSLGVVCSGLAPAVTLHFMGTGAGYSPVELRSQSPTSYTNVFAGLIVFSVDGVTHKGYCLTPESWIFNGNWTANVTLEYGAVGALINKGFERINDNAWQAAAQIAIWEKIVYDNPTQFQNMTGGQATYDWTGVRLDNTTTTGAAIWNYLLSDFGYDPVSGSAIGMLGSLSPAYYVKYSSTTYDSNGNRISQDLGEPAVPGPAASIPFALGFLAACRKRRAK